MYNNHILYRNSNVSPTENQWIYAIFVVGAPEWKNAGSLLYGRLKQPDVHVSGFKIEPYYHSSGGPGGSVIAVPEAPT